MAEDRIGKLSARFNKSGTAERSPSSKSDSEKTNRTRRTFYLDAGLIKQLDATFKSVSHELFPHEIEKSAFLEAVIRHGLDNLDEVKTVLHSSNAG